MHDVFPPFHFNSRGRSELTGLALKKQLPLSFGRREADRGGAVHRCQRSSAALTEPARLRRVRVEAWLAVCLSVGRSVCPRAAAVHSRLDYSAIKALSEGETSNMAVWHQFNMCALNFGERLQTAADAHEAKHRARVLGCLFLFFF